MLDAEDPSYSNWTRFINHSVRRANLAVEREVLPPAGDDSGGSSTPVVRFVTMREIEAGEELLFDCKRLSGPPKATF